MISSVLSPNRDLIVSSIIMSLFFSIMEMEAAILSLV